MAKSSSAASPFTLSAYRSIPGQRQESALPEPSWETPARLNGLRPKNWKKREGATLSGTMAEMVERWLGLPRHEQQNCEIGWGPDAGGHYGHMGASTIARYVERHKLPPQMAAKYQDGEARLRVLLRLPQAEAADPNEILRRPATTPSQYQRQLAAKRITEPRDP